MIGAGLLEQTLPERWRYGVIGGAFGLPFTLLSYWQTGSELSLTPVLFGGILAGYLARRRLGEGRGVGLRAGLVGGLPVIWVIVDVLSLTSELAGPPWFVASATLITIGFTVVFAVLGFGLAALFGEAGGRVGSWVAAKDED